MTGQLGIPKVELKLIITGRPLFEPLKQGHSPQLKLLFFGPDKPTGFAFPGQAAFRIEKAAFQAMIPTFDLKQPVFQHYFPGQVLHLTDRIFVLDLRQRRAVTRSIQQIERHQFERIGP